jgi:hypothetical protein
MKDGAGRLWRLSAAAGLLSVTATANAALIELKAVAVDGVPLGSPQANVDIEPGQEVTAELFISDWGGDFPRLYVWQATIDGENGSVSGTSGTIVPKEYGTQNAEKWSFQDTTRADWIHAAFAGDTVAVIDTTSLNYRYGSLLINSDGTTDPGGGAKFYGGTLALASSGDSCGRFTYDLLPGGSDTYVGPDISDFIAPDVLGLEINVACLPNIVNSCAANCAIDARYPHDPFDNASSFRWEDVNLRLGGIDVSTLACGSDFSIFFAGGPQILLTCFFVNMTGADTIQVGFSQTIPTTRWTCLRLNGGQPGSDTTCLASLPGDINADRRSDGADLLTLIDHLGGGTPLKEWQCDIDRDGNCNQLDMLAAVDVLTGANQFLAWLGATLSVACPSASLDAPCDDLALP